MIKFLVTILIPLLVLAPIPVFGHTPKGEKNSQPPLNLIDNGNFEAVKSGWTNSGGTFTHITSNTLFDSGSVTFDASANGQYFESTAYTVPVGLKGANCQSDVYWQGGDSLLTFKVMDGSGNVLASQVLSVATYTQKASVTFICPTSGSLKDRIESTGNAAIATFDDFHLGKNTGLMQVSQALLFGTAIQDGTTGSTCIFAEGSSTATNNFVTLGSGTGCNSWTNTGSISGVSNSSAITIAQMPPGIYEFEVSGIFQSDTASQSCYLRLTDGTNGLSDVVGTYHTTGYETSIGYLKGVYTVNTPIGTTTTFSIQAADDGAGVCRLQNGITTGSRVTWKVKRYPTSSQIATANTLDSLGSVFYVAQSTCPSGSLVADGSAVSRSTYAPLFGRIGTTHGVGDGSTTFNLPDLRGIFVRGTGTQSISGQSFSGTLGTKAVDGFESHTHTQNSHNHTQDSHNHTQNAHDHTFTINGLSGQGTIYGDGAANTGDYDRYANGGAGIYGSIDLDTATATNNATTATNQAATATNQNTGGSETSPANIALTPCISYATTAAPVFVGSVTSNSAGAERVERIQIRCFSTSAINSQSGAWVSSVSNIAGGVCYLTIASGIFSQTPICSYSHNSTNGAVTYGNQLEVLSPTSIRVTGTYNTGGTTNIATDYLANIICMGPR